MATTKTTSLPSPAGAPPRNKGNRRLIIFMLLQLILVAGVSVGATWAIMNRLRAQVEQEAAAVAAAAAQAGTQATPNVAGAPPVIPVPDSIPEPIFYELAPFTVTVENDVSERILHLGMTLRLADDASRERLERYMPEVRSRVLLALSHLTPDDLKGAEGRSRLAGAIIATLNQPFAPMPVGQYVTDVLFTTFVVQ